MVPHYEYQTYDSKEELFDYIASEDYLKTRSTKGICFGFEVV